MNKANCIRIVFGTFFSLVCAASQGQDSTVKLGSNAVAYGEIVSGNSIVNKGTFSDRSKEYRIKQEQGNFYLLSDGTNEGWVFKSSVVISDASSKPSTREQGQSGQYSLEEQIELLGFHRRSSWRKSNLDNQWYEIWEGFNFGTANKLSTAQVLKLTDELANEINVQIYGIDELTINRVIVEAEIYRPQDKAATIKNAIECLAIMKATKLVVDAFEQGKPMVWGDWKIEVDKHARGNGYDIKCTVELTNSEKHQFSNPMPERKIASSKVQQQGGNDNEKKYIAYLRQHEISAQIVPSVTVNGNIATITVHDLWKSLDYQSRLQSAQSLWKAWALIASPDRPDQARISIVDVNGNKVGGSRSLGGFIWVQDK